MTDGLEAIDYFTGTGRFSDRQIYPLPELLLLDLKMPRKSGFEVLEWLVTHPAGRTCQPVIFTSSSHDGDVSRAYDLGAKRSHQCVQSVRSAFELSAKSDPF